MTKRIKLVVSDFHIGKGSYLPDGRQNILEDFHDDDKFIEFLDHYGGEKFYDTEVELICNGDFFNMLQVDYQDTFTNLITEDISVHKMERIIQGHPKIFDALKTFCSRPKNGLVFLVGNHDAAMLWPDVQELLKKTISHTIRFHPDFYAFDNVLVTHGHRYEFIHHFNPNAFWYEDSNKERYLRLPWGSYFVIDYLNRMKQERPFIDKVKPFRKYLRYALFNDFFFFWKMLINIFLFWLRNRVHKDPVRRKEFKLSPGRIIDAMTHESMIDAAERILKNTSYRIVIMGHSHTYDYRQYGIFGEFFNTGTWTETINLEIAQLGRSIDRTYVYIEYTDQGVPQAKLKRWQGRHRIEEDVRT